MSTKYHCVVKDWQQPKCSSLVELVKYIRKKLLKQNEEFLSTDRDFHDV